MDERCPTCGYRNYFDSLCVSCGGLIREKVWYTPKKKEPPKDGTIFIAKTSFCGCEEQIMLLSWQWYLKPSNGRWSCQCGCIRAEDCIIGDIVEWTEIPAD